MVTTSAEVPFERRVSFSAGHGGNLGVERSSQPPRKHPCGGAACSVPRLDVKASKWGLECGEPLFINIYQVLRATCYAKCIAVPAPRSRPGKGVQAACLPGRQTPGHRRWARPSPLSFQRWSCREFIVRDFSSIKVISLSIWL